MATHTTTVRLPELLKAEADAFAASLGISLNALMAVALRDYLDGRTASAARPALPAAPVPSPVTETPAAPPARPIPHDPGYKAPLNPKHRCPCGSGRPWKRCHGKP